MSSENEPNQPEKVEVILVGTGPAQGTPELYCNCVVCKSARENEFSKDRRAESAVFVKAGNSRVLFDAGRGVKDRLVHLMQTHCLGTAEENSVYCVAVTHQHFDHWGGIDEMADAYRRFQRTAKDKEAEKFKRQYEAVLRNKRVITALGVKDAEDLFDKARGAAVYQKPLKVYTTPVTWEQGIGRAWGHILFNPSRGRPIRAKYEVCQPERECRPVVQPLHEERSVCGDIFFTALPVEHADTEGCVAFLVTVDCNGGLVRILITGDLAPHSKWPEWEEAMSSALESPLDLVVIEANTREPAPRTGHLSGTEALEMLKKWKPRAAVLTHISHEGGKGVTHEEMEKELQQKKGDSAVWIGYDGMKVPLTPGGAPREPVDLLETRRPKPTGG